MDADGAGAGAGAGAGVAAADAGVAAVAGAPAGEAAAAGHERAADGAVVLELAFVRGLHGGNGAVFGLGHFHKLAGAAFFIAAYVQVIAHKMQKRVIANKFFGAVDGVTVA